MTDPASRGLAGEGSGGGGEAPSRRHFPALDGIRGLAVLMVLVFHFCQAALPDAWFGTWLGRIVYLGQSGVDLFFVLSGFLITGVLMDAKGTRRPLVTFYARRALRIFPLYYAVLAAFLALGPILSGRSVLADAYWYLTYTQNIPLTFGWKLAGPRHFWSLAVEEHFYLLWPFIVLRSARLIAAGLTMIVISLACRALFVDLGLSSFYFTLCRLDGLAVGGLLAEVARRPGGLQHLRRWGPWAAWLSLLLGGPLYLTHSGEAWIQVFKASFWAALYGGVLAVLIGSPSGWLSRFASWRPLRSTGKYSYAIYVFHPFVIALLARPIRDLAPRPVSYAVSLAITVAACYLISALSWYLYESRFLALKDRFSYGST